MLIWFGISACADNDTLTIQGKIFIKGTAPHTYVVIEDSRDHKTYKINNQERFDLKKKQKQVLTVKAKQIKKAVGPGFPAEIEVISITD